MGWLTGGGLAPRQTGALAPIVIESSLHLPDGTASAPALAFASDTNFGFFKANTNPSLQFTNGSGNELFEIDFGNGLVNVAATAAIGWTLGNPDVRLWRDAANTLAQRNGTSAQAFRLYRTFTDASNYERLSFLMDSPFVTGMNIAPEAAGTGTERALAIGTRGVAALSFGTDDTVRWAIGATGHLTADTDSANDIGASGANRPRSVYIGVSAIINQTSSNGIDLNHQEAGIGLGSGAELSWTSGNPTTARDLKVVRDAAEVLAHLHSSNGARTKLGLASALVSSLSGATGTAANVIPAGSLVFGVTVRVTTAITGATSFDVGDEGTVDKWGDGIAVAANTTTTSADFNVLTPGIYSVATDVVLTARGGNFASGAVRVVVHYMSLTAATS